MYEVDFGDYRRYMTGDQLLRYYYQNIDKVEYPDFGTWMNDMQRSALIVHI